jgi:hypothetical protein
MSKMYAANKVPLKRGNAVIFAAPVFAVIHQLIIQNNLSSPLVFHS